MTLQPGGRLLAFLALASIVGVESLARDLSEFCVGLSHSMASNKAVYSDPEAAMKEAVAHVRVLNNVAKDSRLKLADAWEAVVKREPCGQRSGDHVSLIARCKPDNLAEMKTLSDAVREYSNRCLTPTFWDEQLKNTFKSLFGKDKGSQKLKAFLSDRFIEQYLRDNPKEPKLHLGKLEGANCCRPWRSHKALYQALDQVLLTSPGGIIAVLRDDEKKLESTLQKHLFKPCESYMRLMGGLIKQAIDAQRYHKDGDTSFIQSQSREFQNAIFRYKYCEAFSTLNGSNEKLHKINVFGFFQP